MEYDVEFGVVFVILDIYLASLDCLAGPYNLHLEIN